jgi:hypothetical protein
MNYRTLLIALAVLVAISTAVAQEAPAPADTPKHCYELNYVLRELDGTKLINQRDFMLTTFAESSRAADWTKLRIGNRIPVRGEKDKDVNYIDVGVNIDNHLRELANALFLEVRADISSVATDSAGSANAPTLRQVRGNVAATISPGKPSVVFSADDPTSQHRFELQVTAKLVR